MTLTQTIVAPWGIWQCVDCRLLNLSTGHIHEHWSHKTVLVHCNDGGALISYTGIGRFDVARDSPDIADWIAEQLEGHSSTVFEALYRLEDSASKEVQFRKKNQIFAFGAIAEDKPWAGVIANHEPRVDWESYRPRKTFTLATEQVKEAKVIVCGEKKAITEADSKLLCSVALRKPKRPEHFLELLAGVNKRASENKRVSERGYRYGYAIGKECAAYYMPPTVDGGIGRFFDWGKDAPWRMVTAPTVFSGINLTKMARESIASLQEEVHKNKAAGTHVEHSLKSK